MIRDSDEFRKKAAMYQRWQKKYRDYDQMIKDLEYEESKIPSTFPDTVVVKGKAVEIPMAHADPHQKQIRRLATIDRIHELERVRDDYRKKMDEVDEAMMKLPAAFRKLMKQIYIHREKTITEVAAEHGYSTSGMSNVIYRSLDKYLNG